ncbi:MAG: nucleotide sugar dehydrogenase [Hyphomicrobiales bacterium]
MIDRSLVDRMLEKIATNSARIGVIGLGYVGLPLAMACADAGCRVVGFDTDETKIPILNAGQSYIDAVSNQDLTKHGESGKFQATADMSALGECDIIVVCVPTPLMDNRDPDLSYVVTTTNVISQTLRKGQTVVLESTSWPGTTMTVMKPILEAKGLKSGEDFFLGFSPEREDPGNINFKTTTIPKVVSGDGAAASEIISSFYGKVVKEVVPVSNPDTAEAVKITENIFRAVNIALVNELKTIYDPMGIDVWEVIAAAKTKPFGFMPFYPGPGLGGHCIPIDPFYLTWRAREFGVETRFIELAGEINTAMPAYVVNKLSQGLKLQQDKDLSEANILVVGLAYKKNVPDIRESATFMVMKLLTQQEAKMDYHDPHVAEVPKTREHMAFCGMKSVALTKDNLKSYDAVVILTDHDDLDYEKIAEHSNLIIDCRNAIKSRGMNPKNLICA